MNWKHVPETKNKLKIKCHILFSLNYSKMVSCKHERDVLKIKITINRHYAFMGQFLGNSKKIEFAILFTSF